VVVVLGLAECAKWLLGGILAPWLWVLHQDFTRPAAVPAPSLSLALRWSGGQHIVGLVLQQMMVRAELDWWDLPLHSIHTLDRKAMSCYGPTQSTGELELNPEPAATSSYASKWLRFQLPGVLRQLILISVIWNNTTFNDLIWLKTIKEIKSNWILI
jgi:hypothetical protein